MYQNNPQNLFLLPPIQQLNHTDLPPNLQLYETNTKITHFDIRRKTDELFFENFIEDYKKNNLKKCKQQSITSVKASVNKICYLNKQLKNINEELKTKSFSENEWNTKFKYCEQIQNEIKSLLQSIQYHNLETLKKDLRKQNDLRERKKNKKKLWALRKKQINERRKRLHIKIDDWIKEKQNDIDREKEERNLSKDADIVLADVRAKRADTKKFLLILKELNNLRRVKVSIARGRGEVISAESDQVFNNIIDKLTQQWKQLDREYSLEEKGLKLMIKTDNEEKISKQEKNVFVDWERALFGSRIKINNSENDINTFITLRKQWDNYIDIIEGSQIPIGWVIPCETSSVAWTKYLKKNIKCNIK